MELKPNQNIAPMLFNSHQKRYYSKDEKEVIKERILNSQFEAKYRKEYYLIASGAQLSLVAFPNYYTDILNNFPIEIPCFDLDKIKVDLSRTFPYNPHFINIKGEEKLGRILLSFSRRNPSIGYSQGFNFIAGRAVLITENEEEAFWLFTHIMEDLIPLNYFTNLQGVTIDHNIALSIAHKKYKETFADLRKASYDFFIDNLINQWFLSLFIVNVNEKLSHLIWDLLMIDKTALVKSAISLVELLSKDIGKIDFHNDNAMSKLTEMVNSINSEKAFLKSLLIFSKLNCSMLEMRRGQEKEKEREREREKADSKPHQPNDKAKKEGTSKEYCNMFWNVCIENTKTRNDIEDYIIHKAHSVPKLYENYFNWRDKTYKSIDINTNDNYFEMLIERMPHVCQYSTCNNNQSNSNL